MQVSQCYVEQTQLSYHIFSKLQDPHLQIYQQGQGMCKVLGATPQAPFLLFFGGYAAKKQQKISAGAAAPPPNPTGGDFAHALPARAQHFTLPNFRV